MKKRWIFLATITLLAIILLLLDDDFQRWYNEYTGIPDKTPVVYKWTDTKGITHVTENRPHSGIPYIEQKIIPNTVMAREGK